MKKPAATKDDRVVAIDTHLIQPPGPSSPVPTPHPFSGPIDGGLHDKVLINKKPAATVGSSATNKPGHTPIGGSFVVVPTDHADIATGSTVVFINGKAAARAGDKATTCNDPIPLPVGTIVANRQVLFGG